MQAAFELAFAWGVSDPIEMLDEMDTVAWTYWKAAMSLGIVGYRRHEIQAEVTRQRSVPLQEDESGSDRPSWRWPHTDPPVDFAAIRRERIRTESDITEWNGKTVWKYGNRNGSKS